MSSLSRRALLRRLASSAGGLALLPLMSRLTRASSPPTPRFVFIVEGNCFEPITLLAPSVRSAINASASSPVQTTDRWWYSSYGHKAPIVVSATPFDQTLALPAITANNLASQSAVLFGLPMYFDIPQLRQTA